MQEYQIESEEAALELTENLTEQAWTEIDSLTRKRAVHNGHFLFMFLHDLMGTGSRCLERLMPYLRGRYFRA
ncbi:hypothetical protein [Candidatus Solincola tengchongensis]|uniref:hypothetical protein n=1 Tax=Candidatus Solincola tengchongensis TaxID=2900693 RepID=UPI00257DEA90|nr:hypothetical protein [Candidatus Solincola tengchongensis]